VTNRPAPNTPPLFLADRLFQEERIQFGASGTSEKERIFLLREASWTGLKRESNKTRFFWRSESTGSVLGGTPWKGAGRDFEGSPRFFLGPNFFCNGFIEHLERGRFCQCHFGWLGLERAIFGDGFRENFGKPTAIWDFRLMGGNFEGGPALGESLRF
jgi:hypothetical protein